MRVVLSSVVLAVAIVVGWSATAESLVSPSLKQRCSSFPAAKAKGVASLPDQRAWRQDVSSSPVHPRSKQIINFIQSHGSDSLHPDFGSPREYGIPITKVKRNQRAVRVLFTAYGDESDHGKYRVPLGAPIEGGAASDGDRHVIALDQKRCKAYELYRAFPHQGHWEADSGVIWNLKSKGLREDGLTSADAAGLPIFAGLVRYQEVKRGRINHALRVTFEVTRDAWIHPASHCAGSTHNPLAPAMGTRLRLKPSYSLQGVTGQARVIVKALKRYGLIVADNGSNWFFQGATDSRWKDDNLNQLKEIQGSSFQVVRSKAAPHEC